ncbi:MAG: PAS domain S-box protein [Proteobacteria bacterium]|nr:PAS domain S-box protein [Pseudomonadota bacterium]
MVVGPLHQLASALAAACSPDEIYQAALETARVLTGCLASAFFTLDSQSRPDAVVLHGDAPFRDRLAECLKGNDISGPVLFKPGLSLIRFPYPAAAFPEEPVLLDLLIAPVVCRRHPNGGLALVCESISPPPASIRLGLETLAAQTALALDRLHAERDIERVENLCGLLVDAPNTVVLTLGPEGMVTGCRPSPDRIASFPHRYLLGEPLDRIADNPRDAERLREVFQECRDRKTPKSHQFLCRPPRGNPFEAEVRLSPPLSGDASAPHHAVLREIRPDEKAWLALRETAEQYRMIFDNASEAIFVAQDGELRVTNRIASKLGGVPSEQLFGRSFLDWIHPDDQEMVINYHFKRLRGERAPDEYDFRVIDKDGLIRWVNIRPVKITWEGRPATLNYLRDVTEPRQAAESLRESEEKYRLLVENSLAGVCIIQERRMVYVNPCLADMLGYDRTDELIGRPFWSLVHPEEQNEAREIGLRLETGEIQSGHYFIRGQTRDGQTAWFELRAAHGAIGGRPAVVANLIDLTGRRQAERARQLAEEKYRGIFENAAEGIFQIGTDGRFINANPALSRILGYDSPVDVLEGGVEVLEGLQLDPAVIEEIVRLLPQRGALQHFESEITRRDGTRANVSLSIRGVRDEKDHLTHYEGFLQDITEQKRIEDEQTSLQAQLQHAQKMEAVGTLASGIAHDFNNILQVISGFIQIMMAYGDEIPKQTLYLKEMDRAVRRAADLVVRLLTFSRKVKAEMRQLDLSHLVFRMVRVLERTIPKMIDIDLRFAPNLDQIMGDPNQIEQLLMNLASNAKDAMPDGGRITIEAENIPWETAEGLCVSGLNPRDYVLLSFSDTGHGMDPETLKHAFEPFFTTKRTGAGTGLGLSTVYGIVNGHGGNITCLSEPGQGAVFSIYLPSVKGRADVLPDVPSIHCDASPGGDETILLADDEPAILSAAQEMLQLRGYRTILAKSGEKALELFQGHGRDIDLVILDLGMPGMGGRQCLREILKLDPTAKVIIASGYSSDEQIQSVLEFGAMTYVSKPYRYRELLKIIRQILDDDPPSGVYPGNDTPSTPSRA